jgi:predicted alpha/beta superfamily hydrolase
MKLLPHFIHACILLSGYGQATTSKNPIRDYTVGEFKLSVYTPPDYDKSKRYRVLYFNDGQNIFGSQGLNLDGLTNTLLEKKLIEPIIIVGIHSDQNRTSNYVPYMDESAKIDFGEYHPNASGYTSKIVSKIVQFIEKKYSTDSHRGIAGYSFGGLHATWAALNFPDIFSFAGSLSPSYWVSDFKIFEEGVKAKSTQTYYFDVGTGEWNYYVPMLLKMNLPILERHFYFEDYGARHIAADWRNRVSNVILLFAGKTDLKNYTWTIIPEVIKSEYTKKFYLRINPVIHYSNGLVCSISYAAKFTLQNMEDGVVNKDGSFVFKNPTDLNVIVSYNGEEKEVKIAWAEIEKIKAKL